MVTFSNFTNWKKEICFSDFVDKLVIGECPTCQHPTLILKCGQSGEHTVIDESVGRMCLVCGSYFTHYKRQEEGYE